MTQIPVKLLSSESASKTGASLTETTCAYCGVGCGVEVHHQGENPTDLKGLAAHPANFGRLCVKGTHLLTTLKDEQRLTKPVVGNAEVSWAQATNEVAKGFNDIIEKHGADAVAFYVSGQLLTEDYYVTNKLMKGYIGSANIDSNSRLCMASAVASYKRAFGADIVPCSYDDLEDAELIVITGANTAWTHPVLFQRIERAKKLNPKLKVVLVDPRTTATASIADIHLKLKPGTDAALFNGLLNYLVATGGLDQDYIDNHTSGFETLKSTCERWTLEQTTKFCQLETKALSQFFTLFKNTERVITFYSMGINQSTSGTDKGNAIINSHLATGKLGKDGCGPFSITGQPNAMGGREVGALANMLAAHTDISNPDDRALVQEFWQSPSIAKKAGAKATEIIEQIEAGKIKAIWIMATNPVASLPDRNRVISALKKCDLVVVSDYVASNDTLTFADIKLPATPWSEKDGTVTNSERRISRQRAFKSPLGNAKPDWQIVCDVAKAMGFKQGFNFDNASEIFTEHAALSGFKNDGTRAFDISALANLTPEEYQQLKPFQWPLVGRKGDESRESRHVIRDGKFYHADGKAHFISVEPKLPQSKTSKEQPLLLNSGRLRDQWHTMTRTGVSSVLATHSPVPLLTIHPNEAASRGLGDYDLVKVSNGIGSAVFFVQISKDVRQGELFAPMHFTSEYSSDSQVLSLFPANIDPISGQPELKQTSVEVAEIPMKQFAVIDISGRLNQNQLKQLEHDHWFSFVTDYGMRIVTFNKEFDVNYAAQVKHLVSLSNTDTEFWLSHQNQQHQRLLAFDKASAVSASISVKTTPMFKGDQENAELFKAIALKGEELHQCLKGKQLVNKGRKVCSCFNVHENDIKTEITEHGADSVEALGKKLKCGTNCGSCKPELEGLLKANCKTPH